MNRSKTVVLVAGILLVSVGANAQDPAAPPAPAPGEPTQQPALIIKKESRLVLVDAVVTDKKGNYVHDLKASDFKVSEDNKEQSVSSFSAGAEAAVQQVNAQRRYLV